MKKQGFTLVELLVVIAIIGVLVGLLLPAVQAAREAARRSQCTNNLHQLALGLLNYESAHGEFPTGGKAPVPSQPASAIVNHGNLMGWHAQILPYIEQQTLYDQIDWTKGYEQNKYIALNPVKGYFCPSSPPDFQKSVFSSGQINGQATYTQHYNGVGGPLFNPAVGVQYGRNDDGMLTDAQLNPACASANRRGFSKLGVLYPDSEVGMQDITDGTSHTICIGERNMGETAWIAGLSGAFTWPCDAAGFKNVQFGLNLCREDEPNTNNHCVLYSNSRPFSSYHPGGVHFANCDGSVNFTSEDTDLGVLQARASRNYGETYDNP